MQLKYRIKKLKICETKLQLLISPALKLVDALSVTHAV